MNKLNVKANSICESIKGKWIAGISFLTYIVTVLPILYLSFFSYATGDDLGKGWRAHRVIVERRGILAFLQAVSEEMHAEYMGREGTWFSNMILAVPPNVFHERLYTITAWISVISLMAGTFYFLKLVVEKILGLSRNVTISLLSLVCFVSIQYIPYIRGGVFWYTGVMHYQAPYCFALISIYLLYVWLTEGKRSTLAGLYLCMFYIGGSHYQAMVISFFLYFILLVAMWFVNRKGNRSNKPVAWAVAPLLVGVIGFIVCALAPGNNVRAMEDGSTMDFSVLRVVETLGKCVTSFGKDVVSYFLGKRLLFLVFPMIFLIVWYAGKHVRKKTNLLELLLVTLLCICVDVLVYMPALYIGGEVSGGVPNTNYFTFILSTTVWITYLAIYLKQKSWHFLSEYAGTFTILFCILALLGGTLLFKHWIGQTADYMCYQYISSGQLADFREQMKERLEILEDDSIRDAVLKPMNPEQGPYMHMDITEDPTKFTNDSTKMFYGKDSVIVDMGGE